MRIYLEKGQRVSKAPKSGQVLYAAGHYNLNDELARTWIRSGVAFEVDAQDKPIREGKRPATFAWSSQRAGKEE